MKVATILDQVDLGDLALPEFQRGYVWNREQVRRLMHALYRKHPVGSLLVWVTRTESAHVRGDGKLPHGTVDLLLDGQQRITTLYGIIRGTPPPFFDGNRDAFTGLHFHLDDETFEFYASTRMQGNPRWVSVTEVVQIGAGKAAERLYESPDLRPYFPTYINRLSAIEAIKEIDLHRQEITGEDKTVDIVVEIFNDVNSAGTKLSKGDLALAKICAAWPEARDELRQRLAKWRKAGFDFSMDWLLRNITTVLTGEAMFSALKDVDTPTFASGLEEAERNIDYLLNLISARLGLDHDRVLGGRYAFPVMNRYLHQNGGKLGDHIERDKLLYWYVHSFLWGRYAGSTETVMNQDLHAIETNEGALDGLIEQLRKNRGNLEIHPTDFAGSSLGARFYPLLYLLTRTWGAQDWGSGIELSKHMLGKFSSLQLHHIFPKALLYKESYSKAEVNAVANFAFLTMDTNLSIGKRLPELYLDEIATKHPGALESQWIPMDRNLWKMASYRDFLAARRELLAQAANEFLNSLLHGNVPEQEQPAEVAVTIVDVIPTIAVQDEEEQVLECIEWISKQGLPEPELLYELVDEGTGNPLAVFDMAWPRGLQEGYSQPVALLIDEPHEMEEIANDAGYRFFRSTHDFKAYVLREVLVQAGAA